MIKTIQVNGDIFTFECKYVDLHGRGFKHVCTLSRNGHELCTETAQYLNRTWEAYEYQTVMLVCAKKVAGNTELITKLKETVMNENARKFRLLSRLVTLGWFQSVTIDTDSISFWGNYSPEIVALLKKHRFDGHVSESGKIIFNRSNILIFLS